jgi:hypothetical protein
LWLKHEPIKTITKIQKYRDIQSILNSDHDDEFLKNWEKLFISSIFFYAHELLPEEKTKAAGCKLKSSAIFGCTPLTPVVDAQML